MDLLLILMVIAVLITALITLLALRVMANESRRAGERPVPDRAALCSRCGKPLPPGAFKCPGCGSSQPQPPDGHYDQYVKTRV